MLRLILVLTVIAAASGCSRLIPRLDEVLPDSTREYRKSESLPDLEVPPDLSAEAIQDTMAVPDVDASGTASYSTYQERIAARKQARAAGAGDAAAVQALADEQVIVVPGTGGEVWDKLGAFWRDAGYTLELDDKELGVLETSWQENQESLTRQKFKVFAEQGADSGTTVLYLSRAVEHQEPNGEDLVWKAAARDAVAEQDMASRLRAALGAAPVAAAAPPAAGASATAAAASSGPTPATAPAEGAAELISAGSGKLYIRLAKDFAEAWRATGEALQRAGLEVIENDRGRGLYFVRYTPSPEHAQKKGMLSRLAFWRGEAIDYQLSLTGIGDRTEIVVLDNDGNWDPGPAASELLNKLHAAFNAAP